MNAIELKNVTKIYDDFMLDNISFSLPKGTIMGLIGGNGAGKTTTIKLIMNSITETSGEISVLGISNKADEFIDLKQKIGVVIDEFTFHQMLTPYKINKIMKEIYVNWDEKLFNEYIRRLNLPLYKKFKDFSKGMKASFLITVALSYKPQLLILDEPTAGLDLLAREEFLKIFNEFTRDENNSILFSSHIISDLEKVCDYITFINNGKLVISEEKDKLLEKYGILKLIDEDFEVLSENAIVKYEKTKFGYKVLVLRKEVPSVFNLEKTTLEDIILLLSKEEEK